MNPFGMDSFAAPMLIGFGGYTIRFAVKMVGKSTPIFLPNGQKIQKRQHKTNTHPRYRIAL